MHICAEEHEEIKRLVLDAGKTSVDKPEYAPKDCFPIGLDGSALSAADGHRKEAAPCAIRLKLRAGNNGIFGFRCLRVASLSSQFNPTWWMPAESPVGNWSNGPDDCT